MTGSALKREIASRVWDLQRFGLTPSKLRARLKPKAGHPTLCNSLPKSGTHLLERALCLHPDLYRKLQPTLRNANLAARGGLAGVLAKSRPGQVLVAHLPFGIEDRDALRVSGTASIAMVRDPRDIVVSMVHYIPKRKRHPFYELFGSETDFSARLRLAIRGSSQHGLISIGERLRRFEGWLDEADLVVRFEDLVGPTGGGDAATQTETIAAICKTAGVDGSEPRVAAIARRLVSTDSPTFRAGRAGSWGEAFESEHETLFAESVGPLMGRFGYSYAT